MHRGVAHDDGANALGWVVALIIIAALAIGGYAWMRYGTSSGSGSNINVTLPSAGGTSGGAMGY